MPTVKTSGFEINYYERARELAIKQGWITVSLVQRTFKLSYGYALSIVDALQHRGVVGPIDDTGRRPLKPLHEREKTTTMKTNDTPSVTKADIPSLALQVLDGLLDKTGTILYSSHETLQPGDIYLIGLNPGGNGGPSLGENITKMLTRTENAYLDEAWGEYDKMGEAPLQKRIQWVLQVLEADLREVLATNLIFAQSRNDKGVTPSQAQQCWPVHEAMLEIVRPSLIVAFGNSAWSPYGFIHALFGGEQEYQRAEHGDWNLKRFQTTIGGRETTVIGLPHMSIYQPMGKPGIEAWLKDNQPK